MDGATYCTCACERRPAPLLRRGWLSTPREVHSSGARWSCFLPLSAAPSPLTRPRARDRPLLRQVDGSTKVRKTQRPVFGQQQILRLELGKQGAVHTCKTTAATVQVLVYCYVTDEIPNNGPRASGCHQAVL